MADNKDDQDLEQFLYPKSRYHGDFTPERLIFNANLQEFAQKIGYICNLETAGKIDSEDAYEKIKELWKKLRASRHSLNIGKKEGDSNDTPEFK